MLIVLDIENQICCSFCERSPLAAVVGVVVVVVEAGAVVAAAVVV